MKSEEHVRRLVGTYLADVEAHLTEMPPGEKHELLRQIESHIYEALEARTGGKPAQVQDVEAVLAGMDTPESYGASPQVEAPAVRKGKWGLLVCFGSLLVAGALLLPGTGLVLWIPFILFLGGQIAAFVLGMLAWRDAFGKAAVYTSGALIVLTILFAT